MLRITVYTSDTRPYTLILVDIKYKDTDLIGKENI